MTTLNLDTRKNIKDTFDNVSSYPRKYVIISILILYIIINLIEYYIAQTSPIDNSPSGKKILTTNELLSNALFVLKNVSLVILILCILSFVDPIPIVTNIIFGKTLNSKKIFTYIRYT